MFAMIVAFVLWRPADVTKFIVVPFLQLGSDSSYERL